MNKGEIKGNWLVYRIDLVDANKTLEEILKHSLNISGRRIQKLTRNNGIFINNKKSFLNKVLKNNDIIKVRIEETNYNNTISPIAMDLDIIYEDELMLIINKSAGIKVYPTTQSDNYTLANGIKYYLLQKGIKSEAHFVHRLDTNTSGAIIIAKNSYAHNLIDQQLKSKQIQRSYIAIVEGNIINNKGTIEFPISKINNTSNKRQVSNSGEMAITHYEAIRKTDQMSLLKVSLETGKTHQIRVHLSYIGHPLLGDKLYGGNNKYINRQALHSYKLSWIHLNTKNLVTVNANIPHDIIQQLDKLEIDYSLI